MKNKSTMYFNELYDPFSIPAMKEYLEEMAENGWLLTEADDAFIFEKAEPVDRVHLIEYFKYRTNEDVKAEYISSCLEKGWKRVPGDNNFLIFYGTKVLLMPIDIGNKIRLQEGDTAWLDSGYLNMSVTYLLSLFYIVIERFYSSSH